MTKEAILKTVKENDIQFVDMQFTDLLGIVKAITIPVSRLEEVLKHNIWFDGSSIEGFTRIFESDMYLQPDLNTFTIIPWTVETDKVTARFICDVYLPDGNIYDGSPRAVLKRQLEKASQKGFTFNVGPELEFFLFLKEGREVKPLPHDRGGYFDQSTDLASKIRQDMTKTLRAFDINVEALHHEVAEGQHEIDFRYGDALTVADHVVTLKFVIKAIAHQNDLHATFMPKPIAEANGSGMHVHQSLFQEEKNIFYSEEGKRYHLSDTAQYFIAGQMQHARALAAVLCPTVNSYKRLVPGYEAPIYVTWATINRSALIRVPRYTPGREGSTRCELRCADPTTNPYLAFALMLAAGMDGIKNRTELPEPMEENIFDLTESDLKLRNISTLPGTLWEALNELQNDKVIRGALGETAFQKYYDAKMKEWIDYSASVSQWEMDQYLEIF